MKDKINRRHFLASIGIIGLAGCVSGPKVNWKFEQNGKPGKEGSILKATHNGGEVIDNTDGKTLKVGIEDKSKTFDDEKMISDFPKKKLQKGDSIKIDISNAKKGDEVWIYYYTYSDNGYHGTSIGHTVLKGGK